MFSSFPLRPGSPLFLMLGEPRHQPRDVWAQAQHSPRAQHGPGAMISHPCHEGATVQPPVRTVNSLGEGHPPCVAEVVKV